jgi:hypothetical protein
LVFAATGASVWLVSQALREAPAWVEILAGCGVTGLILAAAVWTLTLDKAERARALVFLNFKPTR